MVGGGLVDGRAAAELELGVPRGWGSAGLSRNTVTLPAAMRSRGNTEAGGKTSRLGDLSDVSCVALLGEAGPTGAGVRVLESAPPGLRSKRVSNFQIPKLSARLQVLTVEDLGP